MSRNHDIPCRACEGYGDWTPDHPNDPDARIRKCDECDGTGIESVDWDMESVLAAWSGHDQRSPLECTRITYEEAVVALVEEGHWLCDAKGIAAHYGLTPAACAGRLSPPSAVITGTARSQSKRRRTRHRRTI